MTAALAAERVGMFDSFGVHNYRLFWTGGFVSNIGTWMARVAQDWLVLTMLTDNSAVALGLVTGLQFLPTAVLAPWAGTVADRFDKRQVLLLTQVAMAITGFVLAGLVLGGSITLWQVYLLATLQGVAAAFDGPARQAFAPEMVPRRLIANSVGLNTTSFHAARLTAVLGIPVGVRILERAAFIAAINGGSEPLFFSGWTADYSDPLDQLATQWHGASPTNRSRWHDPAFDALLDRARGIADPDERHALYREGERRLSEAEAGVPLPVPQFVALVRPGVTGVVILPNGVVDFHAVRLP